MPDGRLVIIELKRDDTGADAHWQAIKYASYLNDATHEYIVRMLAKHEDITQDEAVERLLQHLGTDDLNALNNDQRIILTSHRFAPQVTSAVLWLNEKVPGDDLITCIQLTPHHDASSNSLYIQVNTIIPVPGTEDLRIGIGDGQDLGGGNNSGLGEALRKTFAESIRHPTTPFLRGVADIVQADMSGEFRPNRRSKWAGRGGDHRYYHLWYSRPPWGNWTTSYRVNLHGDEMSSCSAVVHFATDRSELMDNLRNSNILNEYEIGDSKASISLNGDLDASFAGEIAGTLKHMIRSITPAVDEFMNEE